MNPYIDIIELAFKNAELGISKITDEILTMHGMSGKKTRHLYNNLLNREDARYLEIGSWKGSTVCSAMCENKATVVCIDNWSDLGGPKDEFLINFEKYKGNNDATFIENDCFHVDASKLPKFNIYMYDGSHDLVSHYNALIHYYYCLDDIFIYIVDDWNWDYVRNGTICAIHNLKFNILYHREIRTTDDNSHPEWGSPKQVDWHNGLFIAVLQKTL